MSLALVKIGAVASVAGLVLAACAGRSSATLPAGSPTLRAFVERESEDESIVQIFAAGSNGNVAPARTITFQGGIGPQSNVFVDASLAFLGQFGENPSASLGVYEAGLSGSSNPVRTIAGSRTKLSQAVGVWVR